MITLMRVRSRFSAIFGAVLTSVAALVVAMPAVSAEPDGSGVGVRPVTLIVDGEEATGRVYEPGGPVRDLIVAVHGYGRGSEDFGDYLVGLARRTGTPVLAMDQRSAVSGWRTGEWNVWAGWRDTVAATQWYRGENPGIGRTVLWGWSQGGITSGLAAAYAPPGTFDYWVDTFGHADSFSAWLKAALLNGNMRAQIERDAGGCAPVLCPQAYAERSPALLAGRINVRRTLLVHGTDDAVVPYPTTVEMRTALALSGKPVSVYTVVSGRDPDGRVVPGFHGPSPAFFESGCVVERLLLGTEPVTGGDHDYLIDLARGVDTAPPAPPNAVCAG
ncbi:alpha/beta hydrolase family protein [Nocardia sp. NPDC127526]|uniref:alpha/beta hydrolase family protein n=1 Tax=Nocardia sp. NPDC127526 TaxID=3345393 RepID=UPI003631455F